MSPHDPSRFRHMLEAANDAVDFASAREGIDLDQDKMLALALVKAIEIIGEAAAGFRERDALNTKAFLGPQLSPCVIA